MDEPKKPGLQTQFGDLNERTQVVESKHEELVRRLNEQDREMREIKTQGRLSLKQIDGQSKEVQTVKQATVRTEVKVDKLAERSEDLLTAVEGLKKAFVFFEWVGKRLLPVLGTIATIAGFIAYFKH
jgi:chromosome segregation ATPase